jgi:hypothetical protein
MVITLVVAVAALLAASQARAEGIEDYGIVYGEQVAQAAATPVFTWTAYPTLISGSPRNCQDGFTGRYPPYRLELRGNRLTGTPVQRENANRPNIDLDVSSLNPDGSGKISSVQGDKKQEFLFTFAPGQGPRSFTRRRATVECVFEFVPGR